MGKTDVLRNCKKMVVGLPKSALNNHFDASGVIPGCEAKMAQVSKTDYVFVKEMSESEPSDEVS